MAMETELKLALNEADIERLRTHPLLQGAVAEGRQWLRNTYYDSPDLALARARVALRLRYQGERIIQTLKTRGQSVNGLHQRGEWEWDLSRDALAPEYLSASIWPTELPPAETLALQPVFTTDFERECWQLDHAGAAIEVALDQGWIRCGTSAVQDAILELELELKSGPAEALLSLAQALSSEVTLTPFDDSKAQRGYRLFQHGQDQN
ncbi:CYTH domain-containing protein [Marinobacterium weihaiense]|uniref:CYTH domain-containing protein n=1 Tax=Marinobacterium weihaiense TaxID=2851016 RepID=A0ABS6MAQ9_9GAMM|nr:CYTH domain-containing protein [Marinobacterium weihaiense]MBV0933255.1 CYTH domain-containing protein [Marinobacterium weihaiense]